MTDSKDGPRGPRPVDDVSSTPAQVSAASWFAADPPERESPIDAGWVEVDEQIPGQVSTQSAGARRWVRPAVAVGIVVAVLGVGFAVAQAVAGGDEGEIAAELVPPAEPADASSSASECESGESGGVRTGNGPGDTDTIAGAVLAFQHAFYVDRDAEEALSLTSDESPMVNADALQEGIDSVPQSATHCVRVKELGDGEAEVTVTEIRPDGESVYEQLVTTTEDDDTVQIETITAAEGGDDDGA